MAQTQPRPPLDRDRHRALSEDDRRRIEREMQSTMVAWNAFHEAFGCAADDYLELRDGKAAG